MDSENTTKLEHYEFPIDDVPEWALSLFTKLKSEICAETHARIAYTVRLMLDEVKEEIKTAFASGNASLHSGTQQLTEDCSCKELQHMVKCLKKCKSSALRKEEKKQAKSEYKAARKERKKAKSRVKSSSTEGETEEFESGVHGTASVSNKATYQLSASIPQLRENIKLVSITQISSPPLTPREIVPFGETENEVMEKTRNKLEQHSVVKPNTESCGKQENMQTVNKLQLKSQADLPKKIPDILNLENDVLPSLSDSEFEVVSLPPNTNPVTAFPPEHEEESSYLSDYHDDEGSNGESEAETELIVDTDSEPSNADSAFESKKTKQDLYPMGELGKLSAAMSTSSTSTVASTVASTVIEDFLSTCSNEETHVPKEAAQGAVALPERQRNPYSAAPEEVEKINCEEEINNRQLPPEFNRHRNPYAGTVQEQKIDPTPSEASAQPKVKQAQENGGGPRDPYRVDVLPESLWEEAMTVAAKGYNAAKMVVGNLGSLVDPFAPLPDSAEQRVNLSTPTRFQSATTSSSSNLSSASSSAGSAAGPMSQLPPHMTRAEQQLYEMGFTNHMLNATLLARHKNDIGKVISELLDH